MGRIGCWCTSGCQQFNEGWTDLKEKKKKVEFLFMFKGVYLCG